MAGPSVVQSARNNGPGALVSVTFPDAPTPGNLLVFNVTCYLGHGTVGAGITYAGITVDDSTDSTSRTYYRYAEAGDAAAFADIVTPNDETYWNIVAHEISGVGGIWANDLENYVVGLADDDPIVSTPIVTAGSDRLGLAFFSCEFGGDPTSFGSGWTVDEHFEDVDAYGYAGGHQAYASEGSTVQINFAYEHTSDAIYIVLIFKTGGIADFVWPIDGCPSAITVELIADTASGGRSLTGKQQFVQADAGFWRIVFGRSHIRSSAEVLAWRAFELALRGRARTVLVPLYDRKRAPIPPGGGPIVATADDPIAANAVSANIKVTTGAALEPGQHFSAGERGYRIGTVGAPSGSPPVYPVTFRPPAREAIADNASLEFDYPVCRVRLENDQAMNVILDLMRFATVDVPFVEDV